MGLRPDSFSIAVRPPRRSDSVPFFREAGINYHHLRQLSRMPATNLASENSGQRIYPLSASEKLIRAAEGRLPHPKVPGRLKALALAFSEEPRFGNRGGVAR